jgi:hypothetical protein
MADIRIIGVIVNYNTTSIGYQDMTRTHLIAIGGAVLMNVVGLAALRSAPRMELIAPARATLAVVELAPVMVRPSAADLAAALAGESTPATAVSVAPLWPAQTSRNVLQLLGHQLAMPYDAFGSRFLRVDGRD